MREKHRSAVKAPSPGRQTRVITYPDMAGLVRHRWRDVAVGAAALVTVVTVCGPPWHVGFPLDDAWIHMVYGLALRREGILAYNTGVSAAGTTAPLWSIVAALAHIMAGAHGPTQSAVTALKSVGTALHAVTAICSAHLAYAMGAHRRVRVAAAWLGGLLVAVSPALAFAAASGMEVPLATALLVGSLLAATRGHGVVAGFLAGLAVTTRPECIVAIPSVLVLTAGHTPSGQRILRALGVLFAAAVPVTLFVARTEWVSHRPLPTTFYLKAGLREYSALSALRQGFVDTLGTIEPFASVVSWLFVASALVGGGFAIRQWARRPQRVDRTARAGMTSGAVALAGVLYVVGSSLVIPTADATAFYHQRYLLPAVPLLLLGAVGGGCWLAQALPRWIRLHCRTTWARASTRVGVGLAIVGVMLLSWEFAAWPARRARYASDTRNINEVQVAIGRYVSRHTAPTAVIWTVDAGAVRYWGQRPTVDLVGLNTPELSGLRVLPAAWWPSLVVLLPALSSLAKGLDTLELVGEASTLGYTVTAVPVMARQGILRCRHHRQPGQDDTLVVLVPFTHHRVEGHCPWP